VGCRFFFFGVFFFEADIRLPPSVHFPSVDDDADGSPTPSEDGNMWTDAALDGVAGLDWVPAV